MGTYNLKYGSLGQPVEYTDGEPQCYTDEWKRTSPDYVVYLPQQFISEDTDNVHFLVTTTPKGDLLGVWTQSIYEGGSNTSVVVARSIDGGETWSQPTEIDGPNDHRYHIAQYGFPIVSRSGRIYVFYNKHIGITDLGHVTGIMKCCYSDDDGHTFTPPVEVPFNRQPWDHPDPNVPPSWIAWCNAVRDSEGKWIQPFTRAPNPMSSYYPTGYTYGGAGPSFLEMMRFDNLDEGPAPEDIKITWLPNEPVASRPNGSIEPIIVNLPDNRLFMNFRTSVGSIWYTVSDDNGNTWREAEPMLYQDGGERVLHPASPCPLWLLNDGRYLLQYHNIDGTASNGPQPLWARPYGFNRRSMFIAVGEFRPDSHQPIWFSQGKRIADTDGVSAGPQGRNDCGTYGSLTEKDGKRILWYPDRKHFLLGKLIPDELLADLNVRQG